MELSSDLKFLADLARSLVEVHASLSIQRDNAALVQQVHEVLYYDRKTVRYFLDTVATMQALLERPSSGLSRSSCDVDSAVGQEDWTMSGELKEGWNALWIHAGHCSVESIQPKIFPNSIWGDLE